MVGAETKIDGIITVELVMNAEAIPANRDPRVWIHRTHRHARMQREGVEVRVDNVQILLRVETRVLPHAGDGDVERRDARKILRYAVAETPAPYAETSNIIVARCKRWLAPLLLFLSSCRYAAGGPKDTSR